MIARLKLLLGCLSVSLASTGFAASVLEVVTLTDYPPVSYADPLPESGEELIPPGADSRVVKGLAWDIFRTAMQRQGYALRLHFVPWSRGLRLARGGQIDLLVAVQRSPEREAFLQFSRAPVNRVRYVLYVNDADDSGPRRLDDFAGRRVGVMRNWNYGVTWGRQSLERIPVDDIAQGFGLLASTRIDALAGYEKNFDFVLQRLEPRRSFTKALVFGEAREFVAAPRNRPGAAALIDAFDQGYEAMRIDGALDALYRRWQLPPSDD